MIITIDGPSGSGKSTLAVKLAQHLHFSYLNSGYFYRGLTYVLMNFYGYDEKKIEHPQLKDIQTLFASGNFKYVYQDGLAKIYWIDDITQFLKDPTISRLSAYLAQNEAVRDQVHIAEHRFVNDHDSVVEGRACGSVIFPHAQVKFYLTASLPVRAQRFLDDQKKRGSVFSLSQAIKHTQQRDKMDYERLIEPLIKPEGAIELDSTHYTSDEVFQKALNFIQNAIK